jgi:F0F1-type ATP synthase assembly protein I
MDRAARGDGKTMAPKPDQDVNLGRYLGIGLEIAIGVILGLVVGRYLDRHFGWEPWGTLVCVMLGLAGGMYLLIKEGIRANKD